MLSSCFIVTGVEMVKPVSLSDLRGDNRYGQAVQCRNWRQWAQQVCLVIVTGTAPWWSGK